MKPQIVHVQTLVTGHDGTIASRRRRWRAIAAKVETTGGDHVGGDHVVVLGSFVDPQWCWLLCCFMSKERVRSDPAKSSYVEDRRLLGAPHVILTALNPMSSRLLFQVLVMLCFPLFSYAGVVGTASGMVDLKDMKPLLNMLRPSSRALMVRRFDQIARPTKVSGARCVMTSRREHLIVCVVDANLPDWSGCRTDAGIAIAHPHHPKETP